MALSSPGVEVKVIDESFYTPAEPGTVPLIVVATAENKQNGGGTGTAPGTLKANAGTVYLITSQRDLADTFGDPVFKTDANNNPIHAGEQNEYGLQAAYSLLGVSNRAYVVRADIDLDQLNASESAPAATPVGGTHWFDTANTAFGIFEWNGAPATVAGGQTFVNKTPIVITDPTKVDEVGAPLNSVGAVGSYAVVVVDLDPNTPDLTAKHPNVVYYRGRNGWVVVGSIEWQRAWPTVAGTVAAGTLPPLANIYVNGTLITAGANLTALAGAINSQGINGVTAAVVNGKLEIYNEGVDFSDAEDSSVLSSITIAAGTVEGSALLTAIGIAAGTYYNPRLAISKHTQVPQWKARNAVPRPTGSVWIKTTESNLGARWRVRRFNSATQLWEQIEAPIYSNGETAIFNLDKIGGGANLPIGQLYVKSNYNEVVESDGTPSEANFKILRRSAVGATSIRSGKIATGTFTSGVRSFFIAESVLGSSILGDYDKNGIYSAKTVSVTLTGTTDDADLIAAGINSAGFENVSAEVDSLNRVVISHKLGGEFRLAENTNGFFAALGLAAYNPVTGAGTVNLSAAPTGDNLHDFVASLWQDLTYVASPTAPTSLTAEGTLWYKASVDEVDIMVHDGNTWVGYQSVTSPYYNANDALKTDPAGPQVRATAPETQSDGSPLVTGDLWIDTSDIENYPMIYRFNADLENRAIVDRWILVDKTDQSTEEGVLFADARYNTSGVNSDVAGSIESLLTSNFLDFDAPDPDLYPQGMLLWNLRRSGFNVKRFVQNYVDTTADNPRFGTGNGESMVNYYKHRWVTESGNQADGSGSFGRKAQRKVVVQALQATVNSNQEIRDEEGRVFNLLACPGYPELIGELISLNYDRGLTAFVVGDTPARLTPDATSLLAWGNNQRLALEDNDLGGVSFDEYMGMFYPWGFTSDNFGNNVVVPPSHMILRTIALNDQVAYPWFAPAGVRRGGITNATAVGYVDSEGEFRSVALNVGQRDTLYDVKINPITFITGTGLVNYGQKTRARAASALDRINVARLVIYLRRQLNALAKPYIFEPNDKITRDEVKGACESLLLELVGQRALYDYLVVCDESNNTPSRIDRNELYIDIAIEPVKAVEFIYIPLRLKNTGEIKGLQ